MQPTKSIFASKTFWFNALVLTASVLTEISTVELPGVDPKTVLSALAIVNIGIRLFTTQPVSVMPQPDTPDEEDL